MWDSVIVLCFVVRYFVSFVYWFCNHIDAGCFALFVVLVSRGCCVALSRCATGLFALCDCGIS